MLEFVATAFILCKYSAIDSPVKTTATVVTTKAIVFTGAVRCLTTLLGDGLRRIDSTAGTI